MKFIADLGFAVRSYLAGLGLGARLLVRLMAEFGSNMRRFGLVRDQVHFLGNYSLAIIAVSGLFVGFVLSLQGYYTLQRYGSSEALGLLVALSLVRELGPVVSALLFAGRAGTSLTAEIGLMKAGEQLSAMDMMAVDPVRRILGPRFWGGIIALPLLAAVFSAVGILGGYAVAVVLIGIDSGAFWSQMQNGVDWIDDVGNGVLKSLVFGVAVTFIAVFEGFDASPTPEGVSHATTRTVVTSSLVVLALDFVKQRGGNLGIARDCHLRDALGIGPGGSTAHIIRQAVTGEGELAGVALVLVLEHDAADGLWEGWVAQAVEHDLSDSGLT